MYMYMYIHVYITLFIYLSAYLSHPSIHSPLYELNPTVNFCLQIISVRKRLQKLLMNLQL